MVAFSNLHQSNGGTGHFSMRVTAPSSSRFVVALSGLLQLSSFFLLFLVSSTYFSRFHSDWPYYASEALCSSAANIESCSQTGEWPNDPFQVNVRTINHIPDLGVRFTSESFARLYGIFLSQNDTFASAIAKIHIFKSLVTATLLYASLNLVKHFPTLRPYATRAALCAFSFPYLLFTSASVYSAPIASIALLLTLLTMKAMTEVTDLRNSQLVLLASLFLISLAVVLTNRFETTMFCGLAIALSAASKWTKRLMHKRLVFCLVSFAALFGICVAQNTELRRLSLETVQLNLRVVSSEAADTSAAVRQVGDFGFSLLAPVTFVDNSTRNLSAATSYAEGSLGRWMYPLIVMSWIPLLVIVIRHLVGLFRPLIVCSKKNFRTLVRRWPSLLCLALFIVIPSVFKSIWFFQYAVPLIMVSLYFADQERLNNKLTKNLFLVGVCSNLLAFWSVTRTRDIMAFWNILIESHWLFLAVVLAGFTSIVLAANSARMPSRGYTPL